MIIVKNREHSKDLCLSFIDYSKAFDMVIHEDLWSNMKNMGFTKHISLLLRVMYDKQKAAVRTTYGLTDWFEVGQGVCQGCILSPHLFILYSENVMRNALEGHIGDITIGGRTITNHRYADDIVLIAKPFQNYRSWLIGSEQKARKLDCLSMQRRQKSRKFLDKLLKVQNIWINGEKIETVK